LVAPPSTRAFQEVPASGQPSALAVSGFAATTIGLRASGAGSPVRRAAPASVDLAWATHNDEDGIQTSGSEPPRPTPSGRLIASAARSDACAATWASMHEG